MKGSRDKKGDHLRKRSWGEKDVDAQNRERRRFRGGTSRPTMEFDLSAYFSEITPNATLVCPYGVLAFAQVEGRETLCRVAEPLLDGKTSILAPGDSVLVTEDEEGPIVTGVSPRRSKLSRPAVGKAREQVIAANVDLLVIVVTPVQPMFKQGLVDRFFIAAQMGGVTPLLCVNKMDLVESIPEKIAVYTSLGVVLHATSCMTGAGIPELRELLRGKLSVFAGHSGVGKSSILNTFDPSLRITTREVSDMNEKGKHTTTSSRLYELPDGVRVIDTPGIRQLGLWGVTREEIDFYFPEINALANACKFRDCSHIHEPACAVRQAVESGEIPGFRYASFLRIRESLEG